MDYEGQSVAQGWSAKVRIGIIANNEGDCQSCDGRIGFACGGVPDTNVTRGNAASMTPITAKKYIKGTGYILV